MHTRKVPERSPLTDAPPRIEVGIPPMERLRALSGLVLIVHDDAAQIAELRRALHGLGQDVGGVLLRGHEGHLELERLDHVAHEEVATLNMLHALGVSARAGR